MQQGCVARVFAPPTPVCRDNVSRDIQYSHSPTDLDASNFLRQCCVYNVSRGLFECCLPVCKHVFFPGGERGTVTQRGSAIGPAAGVRKVKSVQQPTTLARRP